MLEEAAPVVNVSGLCRPVLLEGANAKRDGGIPLPPRGLGAAWRSRTAISHGIQTSESPIPLRVLLDKQLVKSIEDELGVERIHGARNHKSMALNTNCSQQ